VIRAWRGSGEYLAAKDRNSRGIAGLSMGGSESLLTGLNALDKFCLDRRFQLRLSLIVYKRISGLDSKLPNTHLLSCGTETD